MTVRADAGCGKGFRRADATTVTTIETGAIAVTVTTMNALAGIEILTALRGGLTGIGLEMNEKTAMETATTGDGTGLMTATTTAIRIATILIATEIRGADRYFRS
jgi:hypothetical protein